MRVSQILEEIREDYLDDTVEPYRWKDTTLRRWLNRAQEEACMRQRLLVDDTTAEVCQVTLVDGQASYTLDSRIVLVERVTLDGNPLTKKTVGQLDRLVPGWQTETGEISKYLQNDLTITLIPTPTASDDGKTLDLRVWRLPLISNMSTGHSPEIPTQHHKDLMWYVVAEAYARPDEDTQNTQRSEIYMAKFDRVFGPALGADVLAHKRRETNVSFVGPGHAYHGRRSPGIDPNIAFDYD